MRTAALAQTIEGIDTGVPDVPRRVSSAAALSDQSDDVLITLFQSGETLAFRVLVERYQERVRGRRFSHDRQFWNLNLRSMADFR